MQAERIRRVVLFTCLHICFFEMTQVRPNLCKQMATTVVSSHFVGCIIGRSSFGVCAPPHSWLFVSSVFVFFCFCVFVGVCVVCVRMFLRVCLCVCV